VNLKYFIIILYILIPCIYDYSAANNAIKDTHHNVEKYLSRPMGQYGVGFEDFHWVNQNVCPDRNFNGKNQSDFSLDNKNYCHEIIARIYYPTMAKDKQKSFYQPIKSQIQEILSKIPHVPSKQIEQFNQIKSFSIKKAEVVKGEKFPVLLFSPGFGYPTQIYENTITELVSNGYIVIGINTPFINLAELPNGHIVKAVEIESPISKEKEQKFVDIPRQDLIYVFNKLHALNNSNLIFSAMDLTHMGLFGHSIGGRAIEDIVQSHPDFFQAFTTLDGDAQVSQKKFAIPFMDMMSAKIMKQEKGDLNSFELGNNGYLVVLSPNDHDSEYSYHMNFSDLSTLQYLPIYQTYKIYLKQHKQSVDKKFYIKLLSHEPTIEEKNYLINPTFVLIKKDANWNIFIYEDKIKKGVININKVHGLRAALNNLPNKPVDKLLDSEILSVKEILLPMFDHPPADFLGTGDGWEIASSINIYLLRFFNTYLKFQKDTDLKQCKSLTENTLIKCGFNDASLNNETFKSIRS
jgi:hypothetical protein